MKILENLNVLAVPLHAYVAAATQPTRSLVMVDLIANLPPPRAMCGFHIPLGRRQRLLQPRNIQRNAVRRLCTLEAPTFARATAKTLPRLTPTFVFPTWYERKGVGLVPRPRNIDT